jgi:hypothetical protein
MLAESNTVDAELKSVASSAVEPLQFASVSHLTDEEIAEYLKDQEIESELLTDK